MKFFLALALCFAIASCTPTSMGDEEEAELRREEEGKYGRGHEREHGRGQEGAKSGCESGGSSDEDDVDLKTRLNVRGFKEEMRSLVRRVNGMGKTIEEFEEAAKVGLIDEPSEQAYEDLGRKWGDMTGRIGSGFDHVALNLVKLGYKLYLGADGFDEVNHCESYKNIPAPNAHNTSVEDSLRKMGFVFLADLQCFRDLLQGTSEDEAILEDNDENMAENTAIGLVLKFIERLHLVRINALRFQAAVEKSVHELEAAHMKPTEETKRLLKLRSFLMKSGLFD